jgi:hypothetical protein
MKIFSRLFGYLLLVFSFPALHGVEKAYYSFTTDPIDVVIPCDAKDLVTLDLCIDGIRRQCQQVRRIIVISQKKLTNNAEWFDENFFPFRKVDIALALFNEDKDAAIGYMSGENRLGWIYQQLLKLYALYTIPKISPNVLVLDADTIFLNPIQFINPLGEPFFTAADEYNEPYFEHMKCLIPWLKRETSCSGIAHHMLFQKCVLDDLFQTIEERHQRVAWNALCSCITNRYWACLSEYEIYFNFILARTDQAHLRTLKWNNNGSIKNIEIDREQGYHFIACHSWLRNN